MNARARFGAQHGLPPTHHGFCRLSEQTTSGSRLRENPWTREYRRPIMVEPCLGGVSSPVSRSSTDSMGESVGSSWRGKCESVVVKHRNGTNVGNTGMRGSLAFSFAPLGIRFLGVFCITRWGEVAAICRIQGRGYLRRSDKQLLWNLGQSARLGGLSTGDRNTQRVEP